VQTAAAFSHPKETKGENYARKPQQVKLLARDLGMGKDYPRSPRTMLGGYVLAARAWTNAGPCSSAGRASIFQLPRSIKRWLKFAELDYHEFGRSSPPARPTTRSRVDGEHARKRPRAEIIAWNNKERDLRLSDIVFGTPEYMEDYIQNRPAPTASVYHWFDVYDSRKNGSKATADCNAPQHRAKRFVDDTFGAGLTRGGCGGRFWYQIRRREF